MTKVHRGLILLLPLLLAAPTVTAAPQRAGVAIGCFCIDGVRGQRHPNAAVPTPEGTWIPWTYSYTKTPRSAAARLFIFDRAIPPTEALLSCDDVAAEAKAAGARLLVAGTLNKLKLSARVFEATSGENRFQVDERELDAELGRVVSGAHRIGGGMMSLAGAKLWVTNPSRLLALAQKMTGTVEIEAWNRTIVDATLRLPGDSALTATLSPIDPDRENVTIRVDTATGVAQLWRGRLEGVPAQSLAGVNLTAGGVALENANLAVRRVMVLADAGHLTSTLADANGTATIATLARSSVKTTFTNPAVQWKRADGSADQSPDDFKLAELSLADALFRTEAAEVRTSTDVVALTGAAEATFARLTTAVATGKVHWTRPEVPALPFLLPAAAVDKIDMDIAGNLDTPRLRGSAVATRFAIGPIEVANALAIPFDLTGGNAEARFPLRFSFGPVGAGVTVRDQDQTAAITAMLTKADLDGAVVLKWPELRQSHLDVDPDRFHLVLSNTVATKPLLAGTAPAFGSASVAVVNSTAISAGETSTGVLKLTTDVLILGQPILRVGDKGHESPSTLTLTANGSAAARYDIANGKMALLRGKFLATDVEFALLDPAGALDLSGTVVTSPRVKFHELSIDIDEEQQPKKSQAALRALSITAARVARPRSPEHPKEVTWDAIPARPLSIDLIEASKTSISDAVEMKQITVRGLDVVVQDGSVQFGEGFHVNQAGLTLKARSIASVDDGGDPTYEFDDASFSVGGRLSTTGQVHINGDTGFELGINVSGKSNRLNGSGTAKVGVFTGSDVTTLPITTVCTLNLPVELNFVAGGVDLNVSVSDGNFEGDGNLGTLDLLLHSTSGASCDTASKEFVIAQEKKYSTTGICCCFHTCEWSVTTPKVAFNYHEHFHIDALGTTAVLSNPRVHLGAGTLNVCNAGAISLGAPTGAIGAVSPAIETGYPGADAIINGIIDVTATVIESTTANVITNTATFFVSSLATGAGNLLCLRP
jgi:hypothetical protein